MRPQATPLYIAGVGKIIKLNRGIFKETAEELCRVAVALAPATADRAKDWIVKHGSKGNSTLTEQLLLRENIITPYSISNPLKVAVYLRVMSPLRGDYLIHLLKESFSQCPYESYRDFMTTLASAIGDQLNKGDEVGFHFFDNGDITITYNGVATGMVNIPPMTRILLDAFIDPTYGIVPDLFDTVMTGIVKMKYD
ncbi:hypothetical protein EON65_19025 [archaeon]|nr:MAG: hypothetical protein EON65_19025 [archaeon]